MLDGEKALLGTLGLEEVKGDIVLGQSELFRNDILQAGHSIEREKA